MGGDGGAVDAEKDQSVSFAVIPAVHGALLVRLAPSPKCAPSVLAPSIAARRSNPSPRGAFERRTAWAFGKGEAGA